MRRTDPGPLRQAGFAYIGMLFALALFGISLGVLVPMYGTQVQREREDELIAGGMTLARALTAYAKASPGLQRAYPDSLERLLSDDRLVRIARYVRQLPYNPFSHGVQWGVVRDDKGGIVGVYSLSDAKPLRDQPPAGVRVQGGGQRYRDWIFMAEQEKSR